MLLVTIPLTVSGQQPVYLDASQPIEERVDGLIPRLTLEEKASLLCHRASHRAAENCVMNGHNCNLHGVVWTKPGTMFLLTIGMAATLNMALIHDVASVIADESRAVYNLQPTVPGIKFEIGTKNQFVTVTASGERLRHRNPRRPLLFDGGHRGLRSPKG
jgi:beta-glucosidase-like glycosyl hydrolase